VADLTPRLEKAFPGTKFQWFQAGSEEVAAKSMAEMLSGGMKADLLISSDRLWYDELAQNGKLAPQNFPKRDGVPASFKHPQGLYTTLSHPLMVIGYNKAALGGKKAPTTYKELQSPLWKGLITTGSPLDSGTNFMTVAVLQKKYGWDYFRNLRKNAVLAEGGNSAVLRRL
jgi:iron(III) transport system substrate-binding protein